jgi:hypothetical protein
LLAIGSEIRSASGYYALLAATRRRLFELLQPKTEQERALVDWLGQRREYSFMRSKTGPGSNMHPLSTPSVRIPVAA